MQLRDISSSAPSHFYEHYISLILRLINAQSQISAAQRICIGSLPPRLLFVVEKRCALLTEMCLKKNRQNQKRVRVHGKCFFFNFIIVFVFRFIFPSLATHLNIKKKKKNKKKVTCIYAESSQPTRVSKDFPFAWESI
ncbi:unnamed protein product [Ceratitis capitata]|uniref:(Mediterranean fruit fly) hypothetical protein n=1 Tax=Ceratitis capitata TaxID=7213 RepID=A0A811VEM9_CERCA|nr:unnamed protein product [Ceratitis capitata]